MDFNEFNQSLTQKHPPLVSPWLKALWLDRKGDWEGAHQLVQDIPHEYGSWVHAYLHRKEGDPGNASYWYHRARKPFPTFSLEKEWSLLVQQFLREPHY